MRRLLIATTALSVALSGMQPGIVLAQAVTEELCPNGKAPPCKGKRQKPAEGQSGGSNVNPMFQAPEEGGKPRKAEKPAKPAAEEVPKPRKAEKPAKPAAEDVPKPRKAEKPAKPAAEDVPKPRKAEKPAKPAAEDVPKPRKPAALDTDTTGKVNPIFQAPEQVAKPQKPAKPVAPKKPLREPAPDAGVALDDIFAQPKTDEGRPARKPAAALDDDSPRKAGAEEVSKPRKERKRVTKEDVRSSSEEFGERMTPRKPDIFRKPDEPVKPGVEKKGGGGLSDLEKAGLVVLGALAVGALLKNGDRVVSNTGDRVVVDRGNGQYVVLKDDDTLLRQPGTEVETENFVDGSTRTTIYRPDGSRVITVRDASGRVLQRVAVDPWGRETLLIDDLGREVRPVDVSTLPVAVPRKVSVSSSNQNDALAAALARAQTGQLEGSYSLQQVRDYPQLRAYAPMVDVENIRFGTGLSGIDPTEATKLQALGSFMADTIRQNPAEMFLIEGHTDAVGDGASNLALSDRRAESLALALTEYFGVPPENMVVQGYGESELLVNTQTAEAQNRRTVVRMISGLLNGN